MPVPVDHDGVRTWWFAGRMESSSQQLTALRTWLPSFRCTPTTGLGSAPLPVALGPTRRAPRAPAHKLSAGCQQGVVNGACCCGVQVGSITKTFAAVVTLQLADEARLPSNALPLPPIVSPPGTACLTRAGEVRRRVDDLRGQMTPKIVHSSPDLPRPGQTS